MDDSDRLNRIRDKVRSAIRSQQDKIERLGGDNPYAERDAGYLSALKWAEGVLARM